jgi:hypothetical protein
MKLTKRQRDVLASIQRSGPGPCMLTRAATIPAPVCQLVQMGFLETLNRMRPGPQVYEITPSGRKALELA